jgi:hypothetical protein
LVPRDAEIAPLSARHPFYFACNAGPMQIPISRQKGFPFIGVRHRDRGGTQRAASSARGREVRRNSDGVRFRRLTLRRSPRDSQPMRAGERAGRGGHDRPGWKPLPCAPASALVSASVAQAGAASPGSHAWIGNRLQRFLRSPRQPPSFSRTARLTAPCQGERLLDRGAVLFRKQRGGRRVNPVSVETGARGAASHAVVCQAVGVVRCRRTTGRPERRDPDR